MSTDEPARKYNWTLTPKMAEALEKLARSLGGLTDGMARCTGAAPAFVERRQAFRAAHQQAFHGLTGATVLARLAQLPTGPVRLELTQQRGRAIVAAADMKAGDVVLMEPAVAEARVDAGPNRQFELVRAIAELPADGQALIADMHNVHRGDGSRVEAALCMRARKDEGAWASASMAQLVEWAGIVSTNCFGGRNAAGEETVAMYPVGAMVNHSCEPNARHFHEDSMICVQAICDIAEGEEIMHPYVRTVGDDTERVVELFGRYKFLCRCNRCVRAARRLVRSSRNAATTGLSAKGPKFVQDMAKQLAALLRERDGADAV